MAENSAISWTDDTFNPWIGCTKVGPGCDGCYAEALMGMEGRMKRVTWGKPGQGGNLARTTEDYWRKPVAWNRHQANLIKHARMIGAAPPPPRFVFCASLADVFDNNAPLEWRSDLFDLIHATPALTWLLLTKRIQMVERLWFKSHGSTPWPKNAAVGFTAVNQDEMDAATPHALEAFQNLDPAFIFWSGEPLLGPVVIPAALLALRRRFWAITGGETDQGQHKARPAHTDWYRGPRDQCAAAGAPYQHKQNGEWVGAEVYAEGDQGGFTRSQVPGETFPGKPSHWWSGDAFGGAISIKAGKKAAGRLLDGREHNDRPEVAVHV